MEISQSTTAAGPALPQRTRPTTLSAPLQATASDSRAFAPHPLLSPALSPQDSGLVPSSSVLTEAIHSLQSGGIKETLSLLIQHIEQLSGARLGTGLGSSTRSRGRIPTAPRDVEAFVDTPLPLGALEAPAFGRAMHYLLALDSAMQSQSSSLGSNLAQGIETLHSASSTQTGLEHRTNQQTPVTQNISSTSNSREANHFRSKTPKQASYGQTYQEQHYARTRGEFVRPTSLVQTLLRGLRALLR